MTKRPQLRVVKGESRNRSILTLIDPALRLEVLAARIGGEPLYTPRVRLRAL